MWASDGNPAITLGICETSEQGVAIAAYSGRLSRMWAWDSKTLEITGFQDIRARVNLLDVSPDGRYCSYYAEAHSRSEYYIAISRPPYFRALWIQGASYVMHSDAIFGNDGVIHCSGPAEHRTYAQRPIEERIEENCPFKIERIEDFSQYRQLNAHIWTRCSGAVEGSGLQDYERYALRLTWSGWDGDGRKISVEGPYVLADGVPFLDCSRQEFVAVSPPRWASEW